MNEIVIENTTSVGQISSTKMLERNNLGWGKVYFDFNLEDRSAGLGGCNSLAAGRYSISWAECVWRAHHMAKLEAKGEAGLNLA